MEEAAPHILHLDYQRLFNHWVYRLPHEAVFKKRLNSQKERQRDRNCTVVGLSLGVSCLTPNFSSYKAGLHASRITMLKLTPDFWILLRRKAESSIIFANISPLQKGYNYNNSIVFCVHILLLAVNRAHPPPRPGSQNYPNPRSEIRLPVSACIAFNSKSKHQIIQKTLCNLRTNDLKSLFKGHSASLLLGKWPLMSARLTLKKSHLNLLHQISVACPEKRVNKAPTNLSLTILLPPHAIWTF